MTYSSTDSLRRLIRSCQHLESLSLTEHRNAICAPEEEEQRQLLSTPSYILHHHLHTFNVNITSSVDALLAGKILETGSTIRRLRINYDWDTPLSSQLIATLQDIAPQLIEFHFNHPTDEEYSLELVIPLLHRCTTLHVDRTNFCSLPTSLSVLPALRNLSLDTFGYNSFPQESQELATFIDARQATLEWVHIASSEDGAGIKVSRFLSRCESAGFLITRLDPPAW